MNDHSSYFYLQLYFWFFISNYILNYISVKKGGVEYYMFKDIKKYDEKVEKEIIYEIWFSMIKLKYEERVKLLYKYGNSRNIYNLCNLTKFKIMKNIFR